MEFPLRIQAAVIDLDGTLLNTAPDLAYAAAQMMTELGRPVPSRAAIETWIGNGVSRLVKRALTGEMDGEPDAALFRHAYAIYERHYSENVSRESRPFPGVVDGLTRMREMGLHLACITNKAECFTLPLLRDTGLLDFFELVLSGDSLPERKPSPLPLQHACKHFGLTPDELLLIGDSLNDTQAARAAGCPVFCVPYGYNRGKPVADLHPDAVVDSLLQATTLITKG